MQVALAVLFALLTLAYGQGIYKISSEQITTHINLINYLFKGHNTA